MVEEKSECTSFIQKMPRLNPVFVNLCFHGLLMHLMLCLLLSAALSTLYSIQASSWRSLFCQTIMSYIMIFMIFKVNGLT